MGSVRRESQSSQFHLSNGLLWLTNITGAAAFQPLVKNHGRNALVGRETATRCYTAKTKPGSP